MAFRINLFNNSDDEQKDPFGNLIKNVRSGASNLGSRFSKSFENFNRSKDIQDKRSQANSTNFARNVYKRTQNTLPVKFANNVARTVGDFSTGIRIDDQKPYEPPKTSNIFNNIRRNLIRIDPNRGIQSNVADALVKAPGQAVYGAAPFVFNRIGEQLNRIKSPVTGQGLGETIANVYRPQTPDQELQQKTAQGTGKLMRDAYIFNKLSGIGGLNILPQTRLAAAMAAKEGASFLPNTIKLIASMPGVKENLGKFALSLAGRSTLNQVLDEKYKDKNIAQNAAEITFDAALTGLSLLTLETGLGGFAGSSLGDNVNFIKKIKFPIRNSLDKQYLGDIGNQITNKIHAQWDPTKPINNPEFVNYIRGVKEAFSTTIREGNLVGAYQFAQNMPTAPSSFIDIPGQIGSQATQGAVVPAEQALVSQIVNSLGQGQFSPVLNQGASRIRLNPPVYKNMAENMRPKILGTRSDAVPEEVTPSKTKDIIPGETIRQVAPKEAITKIQETKNISDKKEGMNELFDSLSEYKTGQIVTESDPILENAKGLPEKIGEYQIVQSNFDISKETIEQNISPDSLKDIVVKDVDTGKEYTVQVKAENLLQQNNENIIQNDLVEQTNQVAPQTTQEVIAQEFKNALEDTGQQVTSRGDVNATGPTATLDGKEIPAGVRGLLSEEEISYLSTGKGELDSDGILKRSEGFNSIAQVYESAGENMGAIGKYVDNFTRFTNKFIDTNVYRQAVRAIGEEGLAFTPNTTKRVLANNYASYLRGEYTPLEGEQQLFSSIDEQLSELLRKESVANSLIQTSPDVKETLTGQKTKSGQEVLDDLEDGFKMAREARNAIDIPGLSNEIKTKILDRFAAVEQADPEFYMNLRLLAGGGYARIENLIINGIGPALVESKGYIEPLNQLLALQRMSELVEQRGLTRKYDQKEIEDGLFALKERLGTEKFDQLVESADKIRQFFDDILTMSEQAGLISSEDAQNMREGNQMYIAFESLNQIIKANEQTGSYTPSASFNVARQDVYKNIGNSEDFIAAPLETSLKKIARTIELADKNSVLKDFVTKNKGTEIAIPLREAEAVKERINLKSDIRELGKVQRRAERLIQTRSKNINKLRQEIAKLETEFDEVMDRPLEPVRATESYRKTRTLFSTGNPAYSKVVKPPTQEKIIRTLIEKPEAELRKIIKKVSVRNKDLKPLLSEIQDLNELFWETKDEIIDKRIRLGEIRDVTTVPDGYDKINVLVDGIKEEWAVPKLVASAIKNLDNPTLGWVGRIASVPNNILRATSIEYNPAFLAANPIRDVADVVITTGINQGKEGVGRFLTGYGRGMAAAFKMDDLYTEWQLAGGGSATLYSNEMVSKPDVTVNRVARKNEKKLHWNKPLQNMKEVQEIGARMTEEQSRIAAFTASRPKEEILANRAGTVPFAEVPIENRQAAFDSRNSSIDFARGGTWTKKAGQIIFLLNPGVQGSEKLFKLAAKNPTGFIKWMGIVAGLPTVFAFMNNRRFEDFKDLSEYESDSNLIFIWKDRTEEEREKRASLHAIKIPIGYVSKPFVKVTNEFLKFIDGRDPKRLDELSIDLINDVAPVPIPIGENGKREFLSAVTPTGFKGIFESWANKNFFTGYDIESSYVNGIPRENVPIYLRTGYDTSVTIQAATRLLHEIGIDISPAKTENLINTQFGGLGREVLKVSDALLGDPIDNTGKIPVVGRFYGPQGGQIKRDENKIKREEEKKAGYAKSEARKQPLIGGPLGSLLGSGDQASAASPEEMITQNGLPENSEGLGVLYKDALNTLKGYDEKKIRLQYKNYEYEGDRVIDLQELEQAKQQAQNMIETIQKERPEDVFQIELKTYGKGSNLGVENRSDWASKQILAAPNEEKAQDIINQMWESGVLTGTANGTAAYIEEIYGLDLTYTGSDETLKKKFGKKSGSTKIPDIKVDYRIPKNSIYSTNFVPRSIDTNIFQPIRFANPSTKLIKSVPTAQQLLNNVPTGKIKLSPQIEPLPQTLSGIGRI